MNLFRIRGIQLSVHFTFFLLLAYAGWQGWHDNPMANWEGMVASMGVLLVFFTCVVLHELGHSFMAMHFGVNVRRILLMPIGGMAEFDRIPREPQRELLITIAGPAVNFVIAGAIWAIVGVPSDWSLFDLDYATNGWSDLLLVILHWNLLMGCFNLVPVFPMDGGRIFRAFLATRLPYLRATFVAATTGKILAIIGISVALWFDKPLMVVLFAFIFIAGEIEYRAVRRADQEEAHWKAVYARIWREPPTEEPPLVEVRRD